MPDVAKLGELNVFSSKCATFPSRGDKINVFRVAADRACSISISRYLIKSDYDESAD